MSSPNHHFSSARAYDLGVLEEPPASQDATASSNGAVKMKKERTISFAEDTKRATTGTTDTQGSLKLLHQQQSGRAFTHMTTDLDRIRLKDEKKKQYLIMPWSKKYKTWWGFTVFCSIWTVFFETYAIAFAPAGLQGGRPGMAIFSYGLTGIFLIDIAVNFNLAAYNENGELVFHRREIAQLYQRNMFWYDIISVFPFYFFSLVFVGELGEDNSLTRFLSLFRLLRLIRLYRVIELFDTLAQSTKISFMTLTLTRNFGFALIWTHFAACVMYFTARQYDFREDETWIGGQVYALNDFERYMTTLYWSIVTFTTVGYGDYSPVNSAEQIFAIFYMLINIIFQSWVIGSITLLVVKSDEKTSALRESLSSLQKYVEMNGLQNIHKRLKAQLKLDHASKSLVDDTVLLRNFPIPTRRKILKRLYGPGLRSASVMDGVQEQFFDEFFASCSIELLSPGEDILQRGSTSMDLYLIVEGSVKLISPLAPLMAEDRMDYSQKTESAVSSSNGDFMAESKDIATIDKGFINDIEFFTETVQMHTVRTSGIVKVLVLSRAAYEPLATNHPTSIHRILDNLLARVRALNTDLKQKESLEAEGRRSVGVPPLREEEPFQDETESSVVSTQAEIALAAVEEMIEVHINKRKDDLTTRFLFAASRDDTLTMESMLQQGFNPDAADYDGRTALMVSAMKGNLSVVKLLIDCKCIYETWNLTTHNEYD